MTLVLIAEQEPLIASFMERGLRINGYATRVTHDACEAAELTTSGDFDLAILDNRLTATETEGGSLGSSAGRQTATLLLVSADYARAAGARRIYGADGVLRKPFRFLDLLRQVRSVLRSMYIFEPTMLRAGRASLELDTARLTVRGRTFDLSVPERAVAEVLFRCAGQDIGVGELLEHARALAGPATVTGESDFRTLRAKLGNELVTTLGPTGYRLRPSAGG